MAPEACKRRQGGSGLRLRAPLDQLLQVDDRRGEPRLNLDAGSATELSPLEPVLGFQVGHDALAHDLATPKKPTTFWHGQMGSNFLKHVGVPRPHQLPVNSARCALSL